MGSAQSLASGADQATVRFFVWIRDPKSLGGGRGRPEVCENQTSKREGPSLNSEEYQRIGAAAQIAKEDLVAQAYADEYKQRYGVEPIWSFDGTDATVIKDTMRKVGEKKARQLLRAYVRMNDEWFIKTGHNLECFKKNLSRVNAFLGTKLEQANENRGLQISAHGGISCDRCFMYYPWIGKATDLEKPTLRLCPKCLGA